jgi:UDP-glucose 4-epimerase
MRVVITGATGYVAYFMVRGLCEIYAVDAWIRPGHRPEDDRYARCIHPQVTYREVDLENPGGVRDALEGAQAVIHLAYAHVPGRYREGHGDDLEGWFRRNLAMHLNLVLGAATVGVRDFLYLSSRAVYGSDRAQPSECDPPRPDSHYGALKAASEAVLAGFSEMRHCAVRSTGVYGCVEPLRASKWFGLLEAWASGETLGFDRVGTEVHGQDLARVARLLLAKSGRWPPAVNVSDTVVSQAGIAGLLQRRLGIQVCRPVPSAVPHGVMACDWLQSHGFRFGGEPLLNQTLHRLIDGLPAGATAVSRGGL